MYPLLTLEEIISKYSGVQVRVFISNGYWAVESNGERLFNANQLTLKDVYPYVDEAKQKQCIKHVRLTHAFICGTIERLSESFDYKRINYSLDKGFYYTDSKEDFIRSECAYCDDKYIYVR